LLTENFILIGGTVLHLMNLLEKWNKPVHEWLLRHVYGEALNTFKMSQVSAAVVTFLLSSVIHELFMAVTLRIARPWLFLMQMSQLPLIFIGRHRWFKGTRLGNMVFWCGIMLGPPLLSCLYMREYYTAHPETFNL